ncbi:MAG: DUF3108 domain-containing protein [Alphaproteobacteria bacterium]|nr:DUF3108 domain-containing protein [Alphaproteobacteria bacterium]
MPVLDKPHWLLALASLLGAWPAAAQQASPPAATPAAAASAPQRSAELRYGIALGPLPVFDVEASVRLGEAEWRIAADVTPVPAFQRAYNFALNAAGDGRVESRAPVPRRYVVRVATPQRQQETQIAYTQAAGRPIQPVRAEPPARPDDLAPAALTGAVDPFAAFALLLAAAGRDGRCPAKLSIYDGYRRFDVTTQDLGRQTPPGGPGGGVVLGNAVACSFAVDTGQEAPKADDYLAYIGTGTLWIATNFANAPPILVRAEAGAGPVRTVLYLRGVETGK